MTKAETLKEASRHETLTDPEITTNPEFGPAQPFQGLNTNSSVHMTTLAGAPSRNVKLSVPQCVCDITTAQDHHANDTTTAGSGSVSSIGRGETLPEWWWCNEHVLNDWKR